MEDPDNPGKIICFDFEGTQFSNNTQCPGSNVCCQVASYCGPNRFCNTGNGQLIRPTCASSPWDDELCSPLCHFEEGTGFLPRVNKCADGSFCCDKDPKCCAENRGVVLNGSGQVVSTDSPSPSSTSSKSSKVSSSSSSSFPSTTSVTTTSSLSSTGSTATPSSLASPDQSTASGSSSSSSSLSPGAYAGIGVAAALGAVAIFGLVLFLIWRGRKRRNEAPERYQQPGGLGTAVLSRARPEMASDDKRVNGYYASDATSGSVVLAEKRRAPEGPRELFEMPSGSSRGGF